MPKRGRYSAPRGMVAAISRLRSGILMKRRRGNRLLRNAIASRVNVFKRSTDAFGFKAPNTAGFTPTLVNAGASPNQLLTIANASASQFVGANSAQFGGSLQFMLSHLANVSEIVNLYDNYRIKKVVVQVIPSFNSSELIQAVAGPAGIPCMHYAVDSDDATVPANRTSIMENSYCRTVRLDAPFNIVIVPRAQNVVATSGGGSVAGGMLPANTWLDTASQNIPHYGLKFWIDEMVQVAGLVDADTPARPFVKFNVTYYLECKNVV